MIRLVTIVDPEGYIYTQLSAGKLRIANAVVSIFWQNPDTELYELWPARKYQQENLQVTDDTGRYSFLVPPGNYYLEVKTKGYSLHRSKKFSVSEGVGVHLNIEIAKKRWWSGIFDFLSGKKINE